MKDNNNGTKDESPSVNLHLQESGNMQKEWFTYALDAIQKLSDKLTKEIEILQKENVTLKNETTWLISSIDGIVLQPNGFSNSKFNWAS